MNQLKFIIMKRGVQNLMLKCQKIHKRTKGKMNYSNKICVLSRRKEMLNIRKY